MDIRSSVSAARQMIERYGLQAEAMAAERARSAREQEGSAPNHWDQVQMAICELRRSATAQGTRRPSAAERPRG